MAAFIQKLFKSRKTPEAAPKHRKADQPEPVEQEDTRASQREEQLGTLEGSPSQSDLAKLAIEGVTSDIRQTAAGRLTDEASLQEVQKQAKGRDKGVYQTVKSALQHRREEQARLHSIGQTIATLIRHAQDQAKSDDTKLYEARLDALLKQWTDVEEHATPEQTQPFLEAVHRCKERIAALQSAAEDEKRQDEQRLQRRETLDLLTRTLDELKAQPPETLPSLASLDALQKTQENRWLEATRDTTVEKQEQKSYETAMLALRNYLSSVRRITQDRDTIVELGALLEGEGDPTDEQRAQAKNLVAEINWPEGYPTPTLLEPLRKLAGKPKAPTQPRVDQEQQKSLANRLEVDLNKLENALEAKQLKESKQLFKTAQQHFRDLDQRHAKPFQARMQLLNGQLRELSDWQGFATEPKQIALCEQMEYLAEQPMDPEAKAERIKELQNEWRDLGGSSDRTLWSRFKAASDKAYEPCKAYFSAKSGLKQANLEKRAAICEQLESFLNNADWSSIDWKAAERIHQTARQEWKEAWPVEFRDNRAVQKRFDELLKRLEAPLDEERRKNEGLKQTIVEKAQALVEHEPLQDAMNQAKALQGDWQAIGITRHREDRKLWQAFRKACDQIFARRDAERSEQQQASRAADETAQAGLNQVSGISPESDEQAVTAALATLKDIDAATLSKGVREQVQQEKQRLSKILSTLRLQAKMASWQSLVMAAKAGQSGSESAPQHWAALAETSDTSDPVELVIRAEILCGVPSPEADQQRRMEIQVQRLANGMGSADNSTDQMQDVEKLLAAWCLGGTGKNADTELAERLNRAIANLNEA
ncbi:MULTISPECIES: DUF349 domain-containing protein [unclassified Marinobacter]|uniref:DUF349 domain-containing protein n=1 Tax=unclassified Marinobacter TaxID=83889 RepID=UPI001927908D|nr:MULTISPECIES: DUF349 domain-containing protein [unclassified Marinobacter]MBL3825281.1 DUF349 domain-containing protein [Marinobacter sp. MC3]MBL3893515.1 DUF349 domain-containing protein [Marinobacter sp. MW3]